MALKVGISGYGLSGRYFHAPLLRGAGFNVSAIVTSNTERTHYAHQDFPNAKIFSSIEAMLSEELDLVVIASANSAHVEQGIEVIKAGIPVVVDKPMGRNYTETKNLIEFANTRGVPITTYFNRRWDSDALTIARLIKEETLGDLFRLDSRFERFRPVMTTAGWRDSVNPDAGGGLLLDLQPHLISTAIGWFGAGTVKSATIKSIRGGVVDDCVLHIAHDNGVDSFLSASAIAGAPGPRIRLLGSKGALVINELDPQEALLRAGKFPEGGSWQEDTSSRAFIHTGNQVEEIVSEQGNYASFYTAVGVAIRENSRMPVSTTDALHVAQLIDDARTLCADA
ncbi:unannotated protein [freshwater metagenome]|uniref:Unannotated protein n=1 Tax=freshwater metagenome TaxID=449393 RepID=A0A6J7XNY3_9ZZZZ|nr:dehydrogenase [Actinomycetota bacterium]